jgi:lipopolysaccharide transport system ATP-binding protein
MSDSDDIAIRVEGLGKRYLIGHQAKPANETFREMLDRRVKSAGRSAAQALGRRAAADNGRIEEFWALRDVSFDVRRGEVVGVIGRNGAGKSTLLKVLSQITEPTTGRVTIKGRVASLLEVGTGFHPELTGRENIYLNGAILGMSRREIKDKFDEIVDFAEVERFLDTPVKRYSSGMYMRLAFAVSAHLEPEILVVDEVLAVGDAEFQRKCLGKMSEVAAGGRTVLFVSHNMGVVANLCASAILLRKGSVEAAGPITEIVGRYMNSGHTSEHIAFEPSAGKPSITSLTLDTAALQRGDLRLDIGFNSPEPITGVIGGAIIRTQSGSPVWGSNGRFHPMIQSQEALASGVLTCASAALPLLPGVYTLSAWLSSWHEDFDEKLDVMSFSFRADAGGGQRPALEVTGPVDWPADWTVRPE